MTDEERDALSRTAAHPGMENLDRVAQNGVDLAAQIRALALLVELAAGREVGARAIGIAKAASTIADDLQDLRDTKLRGLHEHEERESDRLPAMEFPGGWTAAEDIRAGEVFELNTATGEAVPVARSLEDARQVFGELREVLQLPARYNAQALPGHARDLLARLRGERDSRTREVELLRSEAAQLRRERSAQVKAWSPITIERYEEGSWVWFAWSWDGQAVDNGHADTRAAAAKDALLAWLLS